VSVDSETIVEKPELLLWIISKNGLI